tara:strand:- start:429 stop:1169 length:741 start_codon:yes stop_codon:yes gene_type:complete
MKSLTNILISHALFLGIFAIAAVALAQETNTTAAEQMEATRVQMQEQQQAIQERQQEAQENMETRRAEIASTSAAKREGMQERVDERRAQLQERAQTRITNLAANVSNRMDAMIERLQNIIDRIDSRIDKLQENNVDTSDAEASLASAQLSVDAAAAEIANIDSLVAEVAGSEDVRAAWATLKLQYQTIKDYLKTGHTELRNTVASLKAAAREASAGNGVSDAVRAEPSFGTTTDDSLEDTNETEE